MISIVFTLSLGSHFLSFLSFASIGDIYYGKGKDLDWQKIQLETKNMSSHDLEHVSSKKDE